MIMTQCQRSFYRIIRSLEENVKNQCSVFVFGEILEVYTSHKIAYDLRMCHNLNRGSVGQGLWQESAKFVSGPNFFEWRNNKS